LNGKPALYIRLGGDRCAATHDVAGVANSVFAENLFEDSALRAAARCDREEIVPFMPARKWGQCVSTDAPFTFILTR